MNRIVHWFAAPLLGLLLYWEGFTSWFLKDDFSWLGLYRMLQDGSSWVYLLFHPFAQGTIRPISQRLPNTVFVAWFGITAWPFRCLEFITFAAVTFMIAKVCAELTRSRNIGLLAALLWTVNGAISVAIFWNSAYYEILCSLVFLTALWLLIQYAKTGDRRFWIGQWIVFLFGFGVLEQNVVYPALAAAYVICSNQRRLLPKILPMFVPGLLYTAAHMAVAPMLGDGPYKMHWDLSIFSTLWAYFKIALGPSALGHIGILASKPRSFATLILALAVLGFLLFQLFRRRWLSGFFAAWFIIVLLPLLPLRDHLTDYYLTIPLLGFSMLAAEGLYSAWMAGVAGRALAVAILAIYCIPGVMVGHATAVSFHKEAARNRKVVESVVAQARIRGVNRILLTGVTQDLWHSMILGRPFYLYGYYDVYVCPEDRPHLPITPNDNVLFTTAEGASAMRVDPRVLVVDLKQFE